MSALEPTKLQKLFLAELYDVREWKLETRDALSPIVTLMQTYKEKTVKRDWKRFSTLTPTERMLETRSESDIIIALTDFSRKIADTDIKSKLCRWIAVMEACSGYDKRLHFLQHPQHGFKEDFAGLIKWKIQKDAALEIPAADDAAKYFVERNAGAAKLTDEDKAIITQETAYYLKELFEKYHPNTPRDKQDLEGLSAAKRNFSTFLQQALDLSPEAVKKYIDDFCETAKTAMENNYISDDTELPLRGRQR